MKGQIRYLGFGSPIMDAIADVDTQTIEKFNLKLNETIHMPIQNSKILEVLSDKDDLELVPGGCSYNTMRVFNWMLETTDRRGSTGVLGSIGDDLYGNMYADLLEVENIEVVFEKFANKSSGICGVFCNNKDRGHITDLGASTLINDEFIDSVWDKFKDTQLIFTELFIIKHKKNILFKLAELGNQDEKIFGFNLPSFYFIETYINEIKSLLEFADIIFTNAAESIFFTKLMGLETENYTLICEFIAKSPKKNPLKKRTVVITCGPDPAHVCEFDFITNQIVFSGSFAPENVNENDIIDTNGAGDAFAGGFLAKYIPGKPLDECMKAGHWAAALIIQRRGCQYPGECLYKKK